MKQIIGVVVLGALVSGCTHLPSSSQPAEGVTESRYGSGTIAIPTIQVPKTLTSPTRYSKRVRMGSRSRAEDFLCRRMSTYTLVLNANFDATLNVFKHRAGRMGADWIAITQHSEVVAGTEARNERPIYVLDGTVSLTEHDTLTKLEGDIFDCK